MCVCCYCFLYFCCCGGVFRFIIFHYHVTWEFALHTILFFIINIFCLQTIIINGFLTGLNYFTSKLLVQAAGSGWSVVKCWKQDCCLIKNELKQSKCNTPAHQISQHLSNHGLFCFCSRNPDVDFKPNYYADKSNIKATKILRSTDYSILC